MANTLITRTACLVGLCPLIPIPFLDEWIAKKLRRHMFVQLAARAGVTLEGPALDALEPKPKSWLVGCMVAPFKYVMKKIFRTVFFVLMLKDCLDWATSAAHQAQMLRAALDEGALPGGAPYVEDAMENALRATSPSPVTRLMLNKPRPGTASIGESGLLAGIVERMHRWGGGGVILADFRERMREALDDGGAPGPDEAPLSEPEAPGDRGEE